MIAKFMDDLVQSQTWIEGMAEPLQKFVRDLFSSPEAKPAKNLLNGTWLGHPLHPVLTDVPVGAWTVTCVLDMAAILTSNEGVQAAADISLATGLAGSAAAAATGWTDWSDTYGKERSVGLFHGLLMMGTASFYALSLLARLTGKRKTGILLSELGFTVMSTGAYFGGDEVFGLGYGVDHTAFDSGPSEYTEVIKVADLSERNPTKVDAMGSAVVLVKAGEAVYALADTCVHAGCSLSEGKLDGDTIICGCHGSQFRLNDGTVINGPATRPEPSYDVRIMEGAVEVKRRPS
jgi:nitrite reductase/ring-hydroxylating ferredoxin subunit/uncharacterized membrane protein